MGGNAFTQNQNVTPDLNSALLRYGLFAIAPPRSASPPRIPTRSVHHRFALAVLAGYSYEDACTALHLNPRTAERWRTELRRTASLYFGRRVTYEFAARYALDAALRTACEISVRGSPQ